MPSMVSSTALGLVLGALLLLAYLFYRALIPTPIPGIPYTPSAIRPLGDGPDLIKYQAESGTFIDFLSQKCRDLQSPIVQVFMEPFKRPWVLIADNITTEDILTRRTREFDISPWFTGVFEATIPRSHLRLPTGDEWRRQRRNVNDIMSAQFLHNVAASKAYGTCLEMIGLWSEKIRLGEGRPFDTCLNVEQSLLDTIWAIAFGSSIGSTRTQKTLLQDLNKLPQISTDEPGPAVIFPTAPNPASYDTIITINDSHTIPMSSPFGPTHHKLAFLLDPKLRKAKREKEQMITECLTAALANAKSATPPEVRSAAELIFQRERILAEKENRTPLYDTPVIRDELYTLLQAGHDTTATTMQWALKFLTANQDVQAKLRAALCEALGSEQLPTPVKIATAHVPYLDATLEEIFRCANTAAVVNRATLVDCAILGHVVPAGTNVMMLTSGPSYLSPPVEQTSLDGSNKEKVARESPFKGNWDPESLSRFQPERWLLDDEKGRARFSPRAGPAHAMGTGPRHCFGKPMATQTLRIFLTLILYAYDLEPLPSGMEEFTAVMKLAYRPKNVYLRLKKRMEL